MVLRNTFPTDGTGQTVLDTRMTTAGLIIRDAAGTPRTGVLYDSDARIVSPTASMSYLVRDHRAVTSRTGKGVELNANDGAITVATIAAPASNSRVEIIYERARFTANADGSSVPEIAVARGAAAVTPLDPTIPAGAIPLARFVIPSGVTSTQAAGVVGQDVAPFTCATGGTLIVRTPTDLDSWSPGDGAKASCLSNSLEYLRIGGAWLPTLGRAGFTLAGSTWDSGGGIFGGGTQTTLVANGATIGTRTISPNIPGMWRFTLNGAWAENSTGLRQVALRKNNVGPTDPAAPGNYAGNQVAASGRTEFSLAVETQMNGGADLMAFSVYQNSGARLTLTWISMTAEYLG